VIQSIQVAVPQWRTKVAAVSAAAAGAAAAAAI